MRIDELHKFSDGTLNDVRNALDDHLKGIRMQYFTNIIWRRGDKDRATAMIQAIDKMLKMRRIMRSLEKFVGGRLLKETKKMTKLDQNRTKTGSDFSESNEKFSSIDDDSFSIDDIDYVGASPPDSELVSSEVIEIVIPEVGGIDDDILLTIEHDVLREKLRNVNLLISKIKALNANPTPSPDCKTNSGSPTTHSDSPLYASFMFDHSIDPFPPADRSDSYEFTNELIPFISAPEYDCFCFTDEPNSRDFTMDVVENISPAKEPQVLTVLPTHPTLQLNMKF
nr:hypothetical protein [Tanacetum cinerariifolium]